MRILVAVALVGLVHAQAPPQQPALQPGTAVVSGQVLDATTGKPVGGVTVTLATGAPGPVMASGAQVPPQVRTRSGMAITNAQGRFVFRNVPAGDFSLIADGEGYAPGATGRKRVGGAGGTFAVAEGARITDANVRVWKLAAISGFIRDDRGQPVVGVSVWAMRRSMTGGRLNLSLTGGRGESTDERGHYRISGLLPGSYVLTVRLSTLSAPVALSDAYVAAVASGTTGAITRSWSESGVIQIEGGGIVVDDFQVRVSSGQPPVLPGPNGTLLVHPSTFYPNADTATEATVIDFAAADDRSGVDLRLPLVRGVRVSGVLAGPDGPAANQGVRLVPAPSDAVFFDIPSAYSTTDAAGRFAFLGVPAGSYVVKAYRVASVLPFGRPAPPAAGAPPIGTVERGAPAASVATLGVFGELPVSVGGSNVDGLSINLQPGAKLTGRVAFDGTPPTPTVMQRIQLQVRAANGTLPNVTVTIDGEGRLSTSAIAPGRYVLTTGSMPLANTPGVLWALASARIGSVDAAQQAFTVGSSDIDGVLVTFTEKTIALAGTIKAADGAITADSTIAIFPADVQAWIADGMSAQRVVTGAPDKSGAYRLTVRFPGEYLVVAIPPEVAPDIDPAFVKRFGASAVRVSLALGDAKTQPLTVTRPR